MNAEPARIYFDGSCLGNPGPMSVMVVAPGVQRYKRLGRMTAEVEGRSGYAEWSAAALALEVGLRAELSRVLILGDNEKVIEMMKGEGRCQKRYLIPVWKRCVELSRRFEEVRWQHIRREFNLAGVAIEKRIKELAAAERKALRCR